MKNRLKSSTVRLAHIGTTGSAVLIATLAMAFLTNTSQASAQSPQTMPSSGSGNLTSLNSSPEPSASPRQTVKDMVETIARLDNADAGVLSEVSRRQQIMVEQRYRQYDLTDNVNGIYMGTPEEEDVGPPLPPRKKWIDYHVQQLQNLLGILSSELNSLTVPPGLKDSKKAELRAQLDVAHDSETSMLKDLASLKSLTAGPTYNNAEIVKVATHLKQELSGVNSVRKRLIGLL